MKKVDGVVNTVRRAIERALPWYDPDAEEARLQARDATIGQAKRNLNAYREASKMRHRP